MHADDGHDRHEGHGEHLPEPSERPDFAARGLPTGVEALEKICGAVSRVPEPALRGRQCSEGLPEGGGDVDEAPVGDEPAVERGLERAVVEADLLDVLEEVAAEEERERRGDGGLAGVEQLLGEEAVGGEALGHDTGGEGGPGHEGGAVGECDVQHPDLGDDAHTATTSPTLTPHQRRRPPPPWPAIEKER